MARGPVRHSVGVVGVLMALMMLSPAAVATNEDDPLTPEEVAAAMGGTWYRDALSLDEVHAVTTGEGVRVAVIDGGINLNQPEFGGANLEVYPASFCAQILDHRLTNPEIGGPNEGAAEHGTEVSLFVVGNGMGVDGVPSIQGVAPGATLAFYAHGGRGYTEVCGTFGGIAEAAAIDQAVADGADVINLSFGLGAEPESIDSYTGTPLYRSIVAAQQAGVVVVTSTVNDGGTEPGFPANVNGVVTVEALTLHGTVSQPQVASPQLGIVAPGDLLPDLEESPEDVWPVSGPWGTGTSMAAPVVASAIALSMSAWPDATPNQVLQALANTASPLDGSAAGAGTRSPEWGFGALDLPSLIATDPTQFPDENPFLRPDGMPAPEDVAAPATPDPTPAKEEPTGEPMTTEPETTTPAAQPTSDPVDEPDEADDGGSALPFIVGGAALVVVLAAAGVALARWRSAS